MMLATKQITPTSTNFWTAWMATMRNTFFAPGPSKLPNYVGDSTGLTQASGTQGNFTSGAGGAFAALQVSTVWACVRLLAELVGSLPVVVYRSLPDGSREEVRNHPLWTLLHDAPNPLQTRVEWLEQQMLNILIDGNCYDRIVRVGSRPLALYPMAAPQVEVSIDPDSGGMRFSFSRGDGTTQTFNGEDVAQVRLFSNGLKGLSPMGYARQTLTNAMQLQDNANSFAQKGNKPSGVLMIDHVLKPEQREAVRTNFKDIEENNARLFVLEAGMKYQPLTITPEEAEMMAQRKFSVEDICRIYRVPSYMVNDSEKATTWGSGLEQMNLAFLTYTLRPYLTRFEQVWNNRLLTDADRAAGIYCEFNLEALLRADSKGRAEYFAAMVQNGLMSRNEVRRRENYPREATPNADALTVQVNLTTIDKLGTQPPQPNGGNAQ